MNKYYNIFEISEMGSEMYTTRFLSGANVYEATFYISGPH